MPTAEPDPRLAAAAAMAFVADLAAPRLEDDDLHHLLDVRRLRPGESVVASDGRGSWVPCRLASGDRGGPGGPGGPDGAGAGRRRRAPAASLVVEGPPVREPRAAPVVTVAFAPTKGERPEWVVQKLTELGVDRIVLVRTARAVVRWEGERPARARHRLERVARESAAQCRRPRLPEIRGPLELADLAGFVGGPVALARPGGAPPSLARPAVVVGPEGGWEDAEIARFTSSLGLGPTVLRAETAAVAAGALLCGLRAGVVGPLA